jgi:hypothetical protein
VKEEVKEMEPLGRGHRTLLANRTRTEMTSEEKRQTHQKELAEKLNSDARARLAGQKSKTDEKKEQKDEKRTDDPRPEVGEDTVIVRNKKGESDEDANKRVGENNPGKKLVEETDVGLPEQPNELPKEEKKETSSEEKKPMNMPKTYASEKEDAKIKEKVDSASNPGTPLQTQERAEQNVDIPMGDSLNPQQKGPQEVPIHESEMRKRTAFVFVKDTTQLNAKRRDGWETGLTNHFTPLTVRPYQTVVLGSIGPLASAVQREESFAKVVIEIMKKFEGIPWDIARQAGFVEKHRHTDWSKAGFDLMKFYDGLEPEDSKAMVTKLMAIADGSPPVLKDSDRFMRSSVNVLLPYERSMYEWFASIEQQKEMPWSIFHKYMLSKKNELVGIEIDSTDFRESTAIATRPPNPLITDYMMSSNWPLVIKWAPSLRNYVQGNLKVPMMSADMTVEDILGLMGFNVNVIDNIKRFMARMSTVIAEDAVVNLLCKRMFGPYFEFVMDVDIDRYSFNTLLSATMLRLFPKNFIGERWRDSLDNWVLIHYLSVNFMTEAQRANLVWDRDKARTGEVNYLRQNLSRISPAPVRNFWDPDTGYSDHGAYEPFKVEAEAKLYERTPTGTQHWPFAGKKLKKPDESIDCMERMREYAAAVGASRRLAINGNTLHGSTYTKILSFIKGKASHLSRFFYMMDLIAVNLGAGMPVHPQTPDTAEEVFEGTQRTNVDLMSLFSSLVLVEAEEMTIPPLERVFDAVQNGMNMNYNISLLTQYYHFFWPIFQEKVRSRKQRVLAFQSIVPMEIRSPLDAIFAEWQQAPLITDITFPPLDMTDMIVYQKLTKSMEFLAAHREQFWFSNHIYLVPPNTSELVTNGNPVYQREYGVPYPDEDIRVEFVKADELRDLILKGRFREKVDGAKSEGKILRLEVYNHFSYELIKERPVTDARSLFKVNMREPHIYSADGIKWYGVLKDDHFLEDGREDPLIETPLIVMRKPTSAILEMTPSEVFDLLGYSLSRKDDWTFIGFDRYTAYLKNQTKDQGIGPLEK